METPSPPTPNKEVDKTFIIAIITIAGFLLFFYMAWDFDTKQNRDDGDPNTPLPPPAFDALKYISSTLGAFVGIVIGYYFGNKPVKDAIDTAFTFKSLFKAERISATQIIRSDIDILRKCVSELKKQEIMTVDDLIEQINKRIELLQDELEDREE
ncbi:hypothetical protein [Candidatus Nitrosocosmicus hydrocola]|uniref:hypothetical protein n=1 Tax=Candidatus Nitrosocosmicus hydrocola TaxID=1826872 RepID=UPI0011E60028|nr:hypothetical protein [Candidatus Nitrosocosmicus hydrocola]